MAPVDLMAETLRQLVEQSGINPADLDDVIVGCVLQWDQQHGNLGRHAVLAAGLPESVPAVTVDRQCGSGQQAVSFAVHGIQAGAYQLAIGAGVESMSQAPCRRRSSPARRWARNTARANWRATRTTR
jgi:acetyl-CoA C-acetyltransferase